MRKGGLFSVAMTIIKFHTKLIQSILDPVAQQVSTRSDSIDCDLEERVSDPEISFPFVLQGGSYLYCAPS